MVVNCLVNAYETCTCCNTVRAHQTRTRRLFRRFALFLRLRREGGKNGYFRSQGVELSLAVDAPPIQHPSSCRPGSYLETAVCYHVAKESAARAVVFGKVRRTPRTVSGRSRRRFLPSAVLPLCFLITMHLASFLR